MEAVALALAIIALIVAVRAAWYTHRERGRQARKQRDDRKARKRRDRRLF